jgi:peptidoglycan/xylan/chitin deacetylase (PgdA/CDA1 family)
MSGYNSGLNDRQKSETKPIKPETSEQEIWVEYLFFRFFCSMYLVKTPWWLRKLYPPELTWKIRTQEKQLFLTFDDGPHPTVTPFVLDSLKKYNAKATFFCIGNNVKQFPQVYQRIIDEGHAVGNHTENHVNGWKTGDVIYLKNVILASRTIESNLFRPPYGRITKSQVKELAPIFNIIMWDVLSGDFDIHLSPQKCLRNVVANAKPGSVIVFHDSEKAFPRLQYALPEALAYFASRGFLMESIKYNTLR